jgi:hypothetical protein
VQRLALIIEDVRRWLALEPTEIVAEKSVPDQSVKPAEKILSPKESEKPSVKNRLAIKPTEPPRESRGIRI